MEGTEDILLMEVLGRRVMLIEFSRATPAFQSGPLLLSPTPTSPLSPFFSFLLPPLPPACHIQLFFSPFSFSPPPPLCQHVFLLRRRVVVGVCVHWRWLSHVDGGGGRSDGDDSGKRGNSVKDVSDIVRSLVSDRYQRDVFSIPDVLVLRLTAFTICSSIFSSEEERSAQE